MSRTLSALTPLLILFGSGFSAAAPVSSGPQAEDRLQALEAFSNTRDAASLEGTEPHHFYPLSSPSSGGLSGGEESG